MVSMAYKEIKDPWGEQDILENEVAKVHVVSQVPMEKEVPQEAPVLKDPMDQGEAPVNLVSLEVQVPLELRVHQARGVHWEKEEQREKWETWVYQVETVSKDGQVPREAEAKLVPQAHQAQVL